GALLPAIPEKLRQNRARGRVQVAAFALCMQLRVLGHPFDLPPQVELLRRDVLERARLARRQRGAEDAVGALEVDLYSDVQLTEIRGSADLFDLALHDLIERAEAALVVRDRVGEQGPRLHERRSHRECIHVNDATRPSALPPPK